MAPLVLTIQQAAALLAVSRSTTYRLIASGAIETIRVGSHPRIRPRALERYLDRVERETREQAVGLR